MSQSDQYAEGHLSHQDFLTFMKSRCIGLTGSIATGKTTVADMLRKKGFLVVDADLLARQIVEPGEPTLAAIVQHFGEGVLLASENSKQSLNRDKLRKIILSSESERKSLEAIMHPAIHLKFKDLVEKSKILNLNQIFFYEAALIFETGRAPLFYQTWATFCSPKTQLERLCARSGMTALEAQRLMDTQIPASEKAGLATLGIDTEVSLEELFLKIEAALSAL